MREKLTVEVKNSFGSGAKNLFMISTLFQLLGAIEAQKKLKTKNNTLVLLFYGDKNLDQTQLMDKLSLFDYDKLIILDKGSAKSYINLNISLIKELEKESYDNLFVGFFSANVRRFIANLTYNRVLLLDDGVYTISIHNELYNLDSREYREYITPFSEKPRVNRLKKLKFLIYHNFRKSYLKLHGYKNDMSMMNLGFFTMFDLPQYQNELIIRHDFDFLKSCYRIENSFNDSSVYFLGQPLDRALGMSAEIYLMYMRAIVNHYIEREQTIIYIPHRAEDEELFDEIREFGAEVLELNRPFELYSLENSIYLKQIASFNSTALFSMKKLFPNIEVDVFRFPVGGEISHNVDLIHGLLDGIGANIFEWDIDCCYGEDLCQK